MKDGGLGGSGVVKGGPLLGGALLARVVHVIWFGGFDDVVVVVVVMVVSGEVDGLGPNGGCVK